MVVFSLVLKMNAYFLLVFCGLFSTAFSAVAWVPADEGSITCEYEGENLEIGEPYYPAGNCYSVECIGKDGWAIGAKIKACPPMPMTDLPNIRYVRRAHLRYPECCPTIEIIEENSINNSLNLY